MFGQEAGFGQSGAGSAFGQGATGQSQQSLSTGQQASGFGTTGQSSFGVTNQSVFGSAGQAQTGFVNAMQSTSVFGPTTSSSAFGGSPPVFGATTSSSTFGGSPSLFGTVANAAPFSLQGSSTFGSATTASSSGFGQTHGFGVTTYSSPSTFAGTAAFGTGTTTHSPAFGSGQKTSTSGFGSVTTSSSAFGGAGQTGSQAFGGVNSSTNFGGSGSTSAFSGTSQTASSAFGGIGQGTSSSMVASSNQTTSAFGAAGQGSLVFGTAGQSGSMAQGSSNFGGTDKASLAFGGTGQSTSGQVFGGTGQGGSTFGGTGQGGSTLGGAGQGSSSFGGAGQGSSSFGGAGQGSSTFGGTGQVGSTFGGAGQVGSTFGGAGQGSSTFGGTGQGSSSFGAAGQGASTFGGTSQQGSSTFAGAEKSSSTVFGGQTTSVFGSSTGFGTVTTAQGQTASGQKGQDAGSTASLFGGTSTTSVFGGTSMTSAGSLFGGKPQTGSTINPATFVGVTGDIAQQLHPPKTTFVTKTTQSNTGVDTQGTSRGTSGGPQEQGLFGAPKAASQSRSGTDVSARGSSSSKQLFGKTDNQSQGVFGKSGTSDTRKLGRKTSDDTDEAPRAKRTTIRRLSSVSGDLSDKIVIVCKNVPAKYNNARNLRSHFCKFGEVKRTFPNPKRQQATIHFSTHDEAASAKRHGSKIDADMNPMEIFWGRHSVTSPGGQKQKEESTGRAGDPGKRRASDADRGRPPQTSKWLKSEVDDELSSMAGTSDVNREVARSLDRVVKRPAGQTRPTRNLSPATRTRQTSPAPASTSTSAEDVKIGKDSLRTLANSVAHSVADKIQILKLRDKIIRHGRTKQPSLATARAFVGNCRDMCPEMERYDRQEKRRLHPLEILQGIELQPGMNPQADHLRVVKEYSRSSADQEEPLPYELRPISVLVTTMNYLLNEVANRGSDGTWGDWFDFLWNRMRGIRKDIIQQQLCDINTAELLEKCVRFHVFCAERLCEEDMYSFDEKINNENMTKCLQTLKELYHDLLKKHNTFCHNEAEIRAYMILMNLNQGDILRETQQLRAEVRNSVHIRFALQVYSALNSHNYVRFFRLVRDASYLNACIMHRYFTQVRGGALKRILFTCGKGDHQFAVDNLVRILAFENNTEAAEFCKFYGLRANNSAVILNRSNLIQPENNWLPRRAERLIESKRLVSIGEVINGEALQPVKLPAPSFSFDENGKFVANIGVSMTDIVDFPSASTLTTEVDSTPAGAPPPYPGPSQSRPVIRVEAPSQPVPVVVPPPQPQPMKVTNTEVKECAKLLFWEVIDEFCGQVSCEVTSEVKTYLDQSHAVVHSLVEEVVQENVNALSIAYYNEIQVLRQRQFKQEREATLKRAMATLVSEVIKDVTNQELLNLATAKVREVKAELKEQQKARCSVDVGDELLEDVMGELVQSVSSDVYQKDVVERLEKLADIEKCVQLRIAGRYLQVWKKEFSARQKLKRGMLTFPSAPGLDTAAEQIDMLIPDRREDGIIANSFSISADARLSLASSIQLSDQRWVGAKLLSAHELYQNLCHCKAWQPFDIVKLVGGNVKRILQRKLKGKLPTSIYWKLALSLPDPDMCDTEEDKNATGHLNTWLRSKFSKSSKARGQEEVLSLYKADLVQDDDKSQCKLCVCVRAIQGPRPRRGRRGVEDLMGVSGIILTLPLGMEDSPDSTYWRRVRQRLDGLLQMKPSDPAVSLVILCPVSCDQSMVTDDLVRQNIMDHYLSLDKVSNVYILDIDYRDDLELGFDLDSLSLSSELGEAVQWLGEEYPNTPQLCVTYIRDYIDTNLHKHFYSPVFYNLKQRKVNGCLHQRPSDLLSLYNAVIQHLEAVVTSPRLLDLSWPVPEFCRTNAAEGLPTPYWNDEDHLEYLSGIVHEMELPWLQDIDLENTDWSEVCDEIWAFVRSVAGDDQGSAKVDLVSKIRLLLKTVRRDFEDTCYLMEGENRCEPSFENVPWTDLITACIEYRMASVSFTDPQMEDTEEEDKELKVVYFEDHLKSYKPPDTWTYLESHRDITGLPSLNNTVQTAVEKAREARLEQSRTQDRIQESLVTSSTCADIDLEPLSQEEMAAKEDTRRLLESVKAERRESQKFDRYLQKVLNDCDTESADQTFDRNSPLFFSPNCTTPPEFMDASGIEPSLFADCITPRRYSSSELSRVSDFKLLDTSTADQSALTSVAVGGVSDKLTKLQEEIVLYRRSSDIFEQKLQMLIDDGL
ncbi:germinal-center associated nuclear protein-like isoform X2 [Mizuhopecten yessoensis]|uniref:germinal-center associated nuclear protein-like isoform X2 n=1 Tax=Mizuhopecten yessoensis TaxID=6573 RepID=UPI000B45C35C|nr:germinal-center associated nuclear protein-like isoform X2 [Mizuhopecten yessoensis]